MSNETEIETTEETMNNESDAGTATESKEPKTPAWEAFANGLKAHAESLGLQIDVQKGFIKYVNATTGHKLYVARGGREVKRVDTTLPLEGVFEGAYGLEKPNGKIACHIRPDVQMVTEALTLLAGSDFGELPPSKRAPKAEKADQAAG